MPSSKEWHHTIFKYHLLQEVYPGFLYPHRLHGPNKAPKQSVLLLSWHLVPIIMIICLIVPLPVQQWALWVYSPIYIFMYV